MSAMEKVNNILGKLPFVKLAGNIPEGIRGKIPVLNTFIPFAKHIAVILAVVVLAACFGGGGGGTASPNDFSYSLIAENNYAVTDHGQPAGLYITDYSGKGGKVVIPATIEGYPVVAINVNAFHGKKKTGDNPGYHITEVVIPDTVELIGGMAFAYCENLKSINLPASLKRAEGAFFGCIALENITIQDSLSGDLGDGGLSDSEKLPLKTRARLEELGLN